jgi:autotransporter-associated beta strand protein
MAAVNVTSLADFNAYAHSGTTATDRFADYTTNKTNYLRLMTFGFSQINDKTKAASVPKSAEVLLETRLPYLDAAQRRVVLKTTALASGYPIMDDPEGWGRLNLFAAADGYGRFDGDVTGTMNAGLDGFNAKDSWRNDIAGAGKLTKKGTGVLHLTGNNSYTGGTLVEDGVLVAESSSALGNGEVYVIGGRLDITSPAGLKVASAFTQIAGATNLLISTTNLSTAALEVKNTMTLTGGMLIVNFAKNYIPKAGDTIQLVNAGALLGKFTSITINGQLATVSYSKTGIIIKIN